MDQTLDRVTDRWNLLQHSFYQRWTKGTLTRDELCDNVGQYAHVVRAVPAWLEKVRGGDSDQIARHAAEESSHIALWNEFGAALGMDRDAITSTQANAATARLLQRGDELAATGQGAAVVWALEVQASRQCRSRSETAELTRDSVYELSS